MNRARWIAAGVAAGGVLIAVVAVAFTLSGGAQWWQTGSRAATGDLAELIAPASAIAPGYAELPLAGGGPGGADGREGRNVVRRSGAPGRPTVVQQIDRVAPLRLAVVQLRTMSNTSRAGAIAEAVELLGKAPCQGSATIGVFRYDDAAASGAAIVCLRGRLAVRVDATTRDSQGRPVLASYADLLALAVTVSNQVVDRIGMPDTRGSRAYPS